MREDIQNKATLCLDLDGILNKILKILLTCTSTSKFKFILREAVEFHSQLSTDWLKERTEAPKVVV